MSFPVLPIFQVFHDPLIAARQIDLQDMHITIILNIAFCVCC